ncbi:MAG: hypothetical protein GX879_07655, partial [Bacteroidales bacterium]|nr:hypothetical protein [Bacteroidales bacterium]
FQLPDSSIAEIYSTDIMGTKGIQLLLSEKSTYHKSGDTIIGFIEQSLKEQVSMQILPIKNKAEELMEEIQNAITIVTYIFNEETRANLEASFESIKTTLHYLESSAIPLDTLLSTESSRLSRIFANIDKITYNLSENNDKINRLIENAANFTDTLLALDITRIVSNANKAIDEVAQITDKINKGEGTLGLLINNDTLYNNLEKASLELERLLRDVRTNPGRYVNFSLLHFGRNISVMHEGELSKKDQKYLEKQRAKHAKEQEDSNKKQKTKSKTQQSSEEKTKLDLSELSPEFDEDAPAFYMIQILAGGNKLNPNSPDFKGYDNVQEISKDGFYKYLIMPHTDASNTKKYLDLIKQDFVDAFPVGVYQGEIIPYQEAIKINIDK